MRTDEERPVIRTLYDHASTVTDISWHPGGLALASASEDKSIKIYDLQKPSVKRSFRYFQVIYYYFILYYLLLYCIFKNNNIINNINYIKI